MIKQKKRVGRPKGTRSGWNTSANDFVIRKKMRAQPKDKMRELTEKELVDKDKIIKELTLQLEEFPEVQTLINNLKKWTQSRK